MKRLIVAAAMVPVFAIGAAAQDATGWRKGIPYPVTVMGKPTKSAPYSADEITESLQVLSDGTRIGSQSQVTVYRDGEGRVRRETPSQITIWDPTENVSYTLDPKAMTAVKSSMGRAVYNFAGVPSSDKATIEFSVHATSLGTEVSRQQATSEAQLVAVTLDKLKAEIAASGKGMVVNGNPANPQTADALKEQLDVAMTKAAKIAAVPSKNENLGQKVMQGLTVDGTRSTSTIEAGAIGNDRPINTVSERWYSAELQTAVYTKRSDPRTGEETFRLSNVRRGEPGADLFMLPPGYQLLEGPADRVMLYTNKKEE